MLDAPPSPATLSAIQALAGVLFLSVVSAFGSQSGDTGNARSGKDTSEPSDGPVMQYLDNKFDNVWTAGLESGVWCFAANVATITGFQQTSASRGAFLIRYLPKASLTFSLNLLVVLELLRHLDIESFAVRLLQYGDSMLLILQNSQNLMTVTLPTLYILDGSYLAYNVLFSNLRINR